MREMKKVNVNEVKYYEDKSYFIYIYKNVLLIFRYALNQNVTIIIKFQRKTINKTMHS